MAARPMMSVAQLYLEAVPRQMILMGHYRLGQLMTATVMIVK